MSPRVLDEFTYRTDRIPYTIHLEQFQFTGSESGRMDLPVCVIELG